MNEIPITELIRSKRRSIALEVKDDGALVVRAPHFLKEALVREFVHQKRAWIEKVRLRAGQRFAQHKPRAFIEGETFAYLGQEYRLHIAEDMFGKLLFEDQFILSARYLPKARKIFERWYREEAFTVFTKRCQIYAEKMDVRYKILKLSSAKRRWGSCHPKGNLCLNWRLVMAPLEILDYVVVHELAHLKQPNHSKRFWALVAKHDEAWQTNNNALRRADDLLPAWCLTV